MRKLLTNLKVRQIEATRPVAGGLFVASLAWKAVLCLKLQGDQYINLCILVALLQYASGKSEKIMNQLIEQLPRRLELRILEYQNGYVVYDVNSSITFSIDKQLGPPLEIFTRLGVNEEAINASIQQYGHDRTFQTLHLLKELNQKGIISDVAGIKASVPPIPRVSSLFLNVIHGCNLRCAYCYAGGGSYGPLYAPNERMSISVVRAAIDYLLEHSGEQKVLTINFFGGDRKREKVYSKRILFGITTNAILVNRQVIEFIKENEIQFLVSLDGDKKAHDAMRKNLFGKGTYEQTLRGAKLLLLNNPSITRVRATLSSANANIYAVAQHLFSIGFRCVSIGFVSDPKAFRPLPEQWQDIQEGYKKIMKMVIDELRINNRFINFLEFTEDVCRIYAGRKLYYCGTGKWMRAVDPKGNLYPCQRFVGLEEYRLGNVWEGDTNRELLNEFHNLHIYSIPVCSSCWIRHLCGGGCPHVNLMVNGSLRSPDQQICRWFQYALSETMKLLAELGDAGEDHIIQRIYREGTAGQFDRSDTYA